MKKMISRLCGSIAVLAPVAVATQLISSCSNNPTVESQKIDDSSTVKAVQINTQKDTEASFDFIAKDSSISEEHLTALVQVENSDTKFAIEPKVYVSVSDNKIKATITYDATAVTSINDKVKFHITFINTDPSNTWAQTINDLSLTYTSVFLDANFETKGYLFVEQTARSRHLYLTKATNIKAVSATMTVSTGTIQVSAPTVSLVDDQVVVYFGYNTSAASVGDQTTLTLKLKATTENNQNYEQEYEINLWAVEQLYPINTTSSIKAGTSYGWYDIALGLPLGDNESESDLKVVIKNESTNEMLAEYNTILLDSTHEHLTLYVKPSDNTISSSPCKFSATITKQDNYSKGEGYTAGWEYTLKDLTLSMNEDAEFIKTCKAMTGDDFDIELPNQTFEIDFKEAELPTYCWKYFCTINEKSKLAPKDDLDVTVTYQQTTSGTQYNFSDLCKNATYHSWYNEKDNIWSYYDEYEFQKPSYYASLPSILEYDLTITVSRKVDSTHSGNDFFKQKFNSHIKLKFIQ